MLLHRTAGESRIPPARLALRCEAFALGEWLTLLSFFLAPFSSRRRLVCLSSQPAVRDEFHPACVRQRRRVTLTVLRQRQLELRWAAEAERAGMHGAFNKVSYATMGPGAMGGAGGKSGGGGAGGEGHGARGWGQEPWAGWAGGKSGGGGPLKSAKRAMRPWGQEPWVHGQSICGYWPGVREGSNERVPCAPGPRRVGARR